MKFEEAKVEEIFQGEGLAGIVDAIEYAGKMCTAMTPKGGEYAVKFTDRMINSEPQHGRPLEFGTVYMKVHYWNLLTILKYAFNPYSRVRKFKYITTNYRVIVEHNWFDDLQYMCDFNTPTIFHAIRRTLHWTISRVQADSFRTHCSLSSLMQSTRYCNYSKDRFGKDLIYILPQWAYWRYGVSPDDYNTETKLEDLIKSMKKTDKKFAEYCKQLKSAEKSYFKLLEEDDNPNYKLLAQEARGVLPLDVKTEFVQCGYEDDWDHFFYLRVEKGAHPDAQYIAAKAKLLLQCTEINFKLSPYPKIYFKDEK